ncbi:hypothetical protein NSB25_06760 [Acetatifactor muris]|uniref:hypothetical protein n=1 Tax=Acetatifactor muris TaxID=879566 RepID=UPI0011AF7259|nr:hypothetical protein [Acetatifactor muris]MCR2046981.1 hypothetical protein [Acetatifactor muris]
MISEQKTIFPYINITGCAERYTFLHSILFSEYRSKIISKEKQQSTFCAKATKISFRKLGFTITYIISICKSLYEKKYTIFYTCVQEKPDFAGFVAIGIKCGDLAEPAGKVKWRWLPCGARCM